MSEPLSEERLAEIRSMQVSPEVRVVLDELLGEIDPMDAALEASEDEVERLRAKAEPRAVSGSVSRTLSDRWQVRWRENGQRYSRTFDRKGDAKHFLAAAKSRGFGGAR